MSYYLNIIVLICCSLFIWTVNIINYLYECSSRIFQKFCCISKKALYINYGQIRPQIMMYCVYYYIFEFHTYCFFKVSNLIFCFFFLNNIWSIIESYFWVFSSLDLLKIYCCFMFPSNSCPNQILLVVFSVLLQSQLHTLLQYTVCAIISTIHCFNNTNPPLFIN